MSEVTHNGAVTGAAAGRQEQALVTLGDIVVSQNWLVTPVGTRPLRGTEVFVTDMSRVESRIPGWAIVLAILGAIFFLLGLLFLLVREQTVAGYAQVTVRNGDLVHVTMVPVSSAAAMPHIYAQATYVRQLAAA